MKFNKNKVVTFNKNIFIENNNKNSNKPNRKFNNQKQNYIFRDNSKNFNYLSTQNIKNKGGLNVLKNRINTPNHQQNIKRNYIFKNSFHSQLNNDIQANNRYKNNIFKKRPKEIITEDINYNNQNNNIINNYSPTYSNFDNNINTKESKSKIPYLNFKKLEFPSKSNTKIKNSETENNYTTYKDEASNKLFKRKALVISTNHYENNNFDDEKIKTEYENKDDFHNYLKMSSYFNNSHNKNKKNTYESNNTERLRNKILLGEKDKKVNSLKTQIRRNKLRPNFNFNNEYKGEEYCNNTVNNFYSQKNLDYKFDTDYGNDYYVVNMDNKRNKGTLSSLLDSNKKENTKYPHEILHKNKTINYNIIKLNNDNINNNYDDNIKEKNKNQNKNKENNLKKNIELLKITSFDLYLSSISEKKNNINKKSNDKNFKDEIYN